MKSKLWKPTSSPIDMDIAYYSSYHVMSKYPRPSHPGRDKVWQERLTGDGGRKSN